MSQRSYFEHLQHGGFPATSGSKNKINVACPVLEDDVFDKLRFVNNVGTQIPSQIGEERRIHGLQDTAAVIHGERRDGDLWIAGIGERQGLENLSISSSQMGTRLSIIDARSSSSISRWGLPFPHFPI